MAFIRGENVIVLFYDGGQWKLYACAKNCTLDVTTDFIEVSGTGSGDFAEFLPTRHSFSGSIDGLTNLQQPSQLSLPDLRQKQLGKEKLQIRYQRTDEDGNVYTDEGYFFIESSSDSGNYSDANTFTIGLKGTGRLTQVFTAATLTGNAVKTFEYTGVGGDISFDNAVLVNKSIISVFKDGIRYRVITSGTPGYQEVLYTPTLGKFTFPLTFESKERGAVTYQDIDGQDVSFPLIFDGTFNNSFN